MLSEQEQERIERMISKNTGGDLQKEMRRYLDRLIEKIVGKERGEDEGTT